MAIFISYSSQDRTSLEALTTALKRAQQKVWFDQELGGGDTWWNAILEQIQSCDVFIVALSNHWLQSKPSLAELRYAQALNRPILPVQVGPVDSVRVNPVSNLQIIDYQNPTADTGIQLVTAIHALRDKAAPLPDPLPDEPPVPFGYIMRLGNTLSEKELTPQQQLQLLVELRSGFDEDGDDPSARGDIGQLLRMLRMRHDVTYRTRTEIDNVLAEIEAKDGSPAVPAKEPNPTPSGPRAQPVSAPATSAPSAPQQPAGSAGGQGSNKRLAIIGGAALAVVVAIALVFFLTQGSKPKPAAKSGAAPPTAAGAMTGGAPTGPAAAVGGTTNSGRLASFLLSPNEIGVLVDDQNMKLGDTNEQPRKIGSLSNAACSGAYEPITEAAYNGADGFVAAHGQAVQTPGENVTHRTYEAVAAFASADKARAFVETSAANWTGCAGQPVTLTTPKKKLDWTFGQLEGAPPKIWMQRTEASGHVCHHVLRAVSDVVVDVLSCAPADVSGPAGKIADQIADKVTQ